MAAYCYENWVKHLALWALGLYADFPPGWNASILQGNPSALNVQVPMLGREALIVECLAQENNTMPSQGLNADQLFWR